MNIYIYVRSAFFFFFEISARSPDQFFFPFHGRANRIRSIFFLPPLSHSTRYTTQQHRTIIIIIISVIPYTVHNYLFRLVSYRKSPYRNIFHFISCRRYIIYTTSLQYFLYYNDNNDYVCPDVYILYGYAQSVDPMLFAYYIWRTHVCETYRNIIIIVHINYFARRTF